jgi:hypothetical protein
MDLYDQALEIYQGAVQADDARASALGMEANSKLKKITKRLEELQRAAQQTNKSEQRIAEVLSKTVAWNKEVVNKCLGIAI